MKTENNKLIAEFMGYKNIANDEDKQDYLNDILQYHKDWNLLMLAVEKIESLGYTVTIAGVMCKITKVLDIENSIVSYVLGDKSRKLELVYITLTAFIKWYNQQKN